MLLKREIGPESLAVEAVVGAVLHGRESASLGRTRSSHVRHKFRFKFAPISHHLGHDRATIVVLAVRRSPSDRLAAVTPRQPSDRGSIGPRSWSSSTIGLRRPMTLQVSGWPRLRDRVETGFEERPPSDVRRSR